MGRITIRKKHPEAREDEVCLCMIALWDYDHHDRFEGFRDIGWETKRLGREDIKAGRFTHPVFVSRKELEEAGFEIVEDLIIEEDVVTQKSFFNRLKSFFDKIFS